MSFRLYFESENRIPSSKFKWKTNHVFVILFIGTEFFFVKESLKNRISIYGTLRYLFLHDHISLKIKVLILKLLLKKAFNRRAFFEDLNLLSGLDFTLIKLQKDKMF